jgi:hypothetical protein
VNSLRAISLPRASTLMSWCSFTTRPGIATWRRTSVLPLALIRLGVGRNPRGRRDRCDGASFKPNELTRYVREVKRGWDEVIN